MTAVQEVRVGQVWRRKTDGKHVTITYRYESQCASIWDDENFEEADIVPDHTLFRNYDLVKETGE